LETQQDIAERKVRSALTAKVSGKSAREIELERAVIEKAITHWKLRREYSGYTFEDTDFDDAVLALISAREKQ
jgi:hypothetical protein